MAFSPFGGELSGIPTQEGSFEITVSLDGPDGTGEATCMLEVGAALTVDLSVLARPCLGPGDSVTDVLVGGDGSALTCATPSSLPAGQTFLAPPQYLVPASSSSPSRSAANTCHGKLAWSQGASTTCPRN